MRNFCMQVNITLLNAVLSIIFYDICFILESCMIKNKIDMIRVKFLWSSLGKKKYSYNLVAMENVCISSRLMSTNYRGGRQGPGICTLCRGDKWEPTTTPFFFWWFICYRYCIFLSTSEKELHQAGSIDNWFNLKEMARSRRKQDHICGTCLNIVGVIIWNMWLKNTIEILIIFPLFYHHVALKKILK